MPRWNPDVLNTQWQKTPLSDSLADYSGKRSPHPKIIETTTWNCFSTYSNFQDYQIRVFPPPLPHMEPFPMIFKRYLLMELSKNSVATPETLILTSPTLQYLGKNKFLKTDYFCNKVFLSFLFSFLSCL